MERARVTVVIFACVLFCEHQSVFGTEVDMRVKTGASITLYSDCDIPLGSHIVWLRNCSHEHQPLLLIDSSKLFLWTFPRFSFVQNSSSNSYDLHIENVSVSDEGIYYCAIDERKVNDVHGVIGSQYQYGNRRTHLSVLESKSFHTETFNITSTFPVSDLYSKLLFSVCPVCVLLFSISVYCLCQRKTTVSAATQTENSFFEREDEVCYASLNTLSMLKKKRLQSSDFTTYTEVRTKRT
ncbi:uncharacterized protein LOC130071392 [Rhinichthys klamathensis goyatoka]|uniref:uncharacterized protein LOC130071392 n=1 Tax=Rhinichthys klamathensis goyatoka TaxID=3034132 RepID=UPI0024B549A4|nr:uncharacterized protein LOC130071392 [Rhinichthys klamathensis goyatoka]